jgi:hypothetical protein
MTISNAQPIQFWPVDENTFNETEVEGINYICWCEPFNCDQEIPVQVLDTESQIYTLDILEGEDVIDTLDLDEVEDGVYELVFVPTDLSPEICNTKVAYQLKKNGVAVYKSDCTHVKTNHSNTVLIEYWNNRNFAGLVYADTSPVTHFFLRVPCVFFHNRFPQEDKAFERTASTVITASKIKKQRLMQIEHSPDYFHEKLLLALSHHNVLIDGKYWKKEEAYEKDEGDIKYPLKKATVWLTEKNSPVRNVL